jgi:hypothetical protein
MDGCRVDADAGRRTQLILTIVPHASNDLDLNDGADTIAAIVRNRINLGGGAGAARPAGASPLPIPGSP